MVAGEDAQMVAGLVGQPLVVVCVEAHKYGGATESGIRDLGNTAAQSSIWSVSVPNECIGSTAQHFTDSPKQD